MIRHRWGVMGVVLAISALLAGQIPSLRTRSAVEAFLHEDDPALLRYDEFRAQFGRDQLIVVAIESPELLSIPFLERIRDFHLALEAEVPHLDEVTSLLNARLSLGHGDQLIVENLLAHWPSTDDDLALLRERLFSNPLFENTLISADGRYTTVTIKPDTYSSLQAPAQQSGGSLDEQGYEFAEGDEPAGPLRFLSEEEAAEHVRAIEAVLERFDSSDFETHMAGGIAMGVRISRAVQADINKFMGLAGLVVVLLLYLSFRHLLGVVLPLVVVGLALGSTLGSMALLDIPLSITTEILPPFLLTVGICDSVHILVIYERRLLMGESSREEAIVGALTHSGAAVVMTSLTTAGGLLSFVLAPVAPIAHLGIAAPLGVMLALFYTLCLLPAALSLLPPPKRWRGAMRRRPVEEVLAACGELAVRRPVWIVCVCAGTLLLAVAGAPRLRFSQNELLWFPEDAPLRLDTELIDRELRGAMSLDLLLETDEPGALYNPALLQSLDRLASENRSFQHGDFFIGKTISIADLVKEVHRALGENQPEAYTIPDDRQVIAQEILLFENSGSDDLESLVDSEMKLARIHLRIPWADSALYPQLIAAVEQHVEPVLAGLGRLSLTGLSPLMGGIFAAAIETLWRSYALAIAIILPLMALLMGSMRMGLLSMIPNVLPIVLTLGIMGWLRLPLDMSNLLIGGIVLGVAVDDTIHVFHRFDRYRSESGDPAAAIRLTLQSTGRALLLTSLAVASGFGVLAFAYMNNISSFGILAGGAVALAFLADILLAPALLMLVYDKAPARRHAGGLWRRFKA